MSLLDTLERIGEFASTYFVVWVLLFSAGALVSPSSFTWISPYITPLLGIIMLEMGLTLRPADFKRIAERPRDVAIGAVAQWVVMPLAAWLSPWRSRSRRRSRLASSCWVLRRAAQLQT